MDKKLREAAVAECVPQKTDFTLMWWANGWRGVSPEGRKIACFQTGQYGFTLDVAAAQILNFGAIDHPRGYLGTALQNNDVIFGLPASKLDIALRVAGQTFRCVRAGNVVDTSGGWERNMPWRIIDNGRCVQRFDLLGLVFEDSEKKALAMSGRLEMTAFADRLALRLELVPSSDMPAIHGEICVLVDGKALKTEAMLGADGSWKKDEMKEMALSVFPKARKVDPEVTASETVAVTDMSNSSPVSAVYDPTRGWHYIDLPKVSWKIGDDLNHMERHALRIANPTDQPRTVRLLFAKDYPFTSLPGTSPILRDKNGNPTGIPVQISKNWHKVDEHYLYEGPWFHGFAVLHLPAHSTFEGEFDMAYAGWGGVPAASHSQLCLIGWGTNQLWDTSAIGSWGEQFAYDPEVTQRRAIIDDVRPLMVRSMYPDYGKWGWTNNVGGGDFLVYFDEAGKKQFLSRMRAAYSSQCPNLTSVTYAGFSQDNKIAAEITLSLPRSDDYMRGFHTMRYRVLEPVKFSRLAFYQMGADHFNDHQFEKMARGNENGLIEEWAPVKGGNKYSRTAIPCEGKAPWFSLHEAHDYRVDVKGDFANRGLVIRSWKARLGGKDVPAPYAAIYGTEDQCPSAGLELSIPEGLTQLQPGDYVEAMVEYVVVPIKTEDYYGPNEFLRKALTTNGNTWKMIEREAVGNLLDVKAIRGKVAHSYPIVIDAEHDAAEIEVTGGMGYVPITFRGLGDYAGYDLFQTINSQTTRIDQSVHGNDFWQADYDPASKRWSLTYNICLDSETKRTVTFNLKKKMDWEIASPSSLIISNAPSTMETNQFHPARKPRAHLSSAKDTKMTNSLRQAAVAELMPSTTDYTYMWWAYGWRGRSPEGNRVMCWQTGKYGLVMDMDHAKALQFGAIHNAKSFLESASQGNDVVFALPKSDLNLTVEAGGKTYRCVSTGNVTDDSSYWHRNTPWRLIESGRFMQRADMLGLCFETDAKEQLPAMGRLEIAAWPDRVVFLLELDPTADLPAARVEITAMLEGKEFKAQAQFGQGAWKKGEMKNVSLSLFPDQKIADASNAPEETVIITDIANRMSVSATYDPARGWHYIALPKVDWSPPEDFNHIERMKVRVENNSDLPRNIRLNFAKDYQFPAIFGMTPMLRDSDGNPTGIPVQISKNWHHVPDGTYLYEGPWFHGFTMVRVPARSAFDGEFDLVYAGWGGVPAASHAQLCLIGWGTNQLWDQAAIGAWGEQICYDPDVNLQRSMIDDVRPLMVKTMRDSAKWGWTNNVGGGDFLVYFDEKGEKQFLTRMHTAYRDYGPNLTCVTYAGVTADAKIAAKITVSSPRCDDINRAFHHLRYDVLAPVKFSRLAFYQLGSDGYNDHQFEKMARGNAKGMIEEWIPEKGGKKYHRTDIACEGEAPWFSLQDAHDFREATKGAWGNRGLVIRSWKARLGGKDIAVPCAAIYGTEDQTPSANVELSLPSDIKELLPGDFVEAEVEFIVMPIQADDYYGPNENLRKALEANANTWQMIHREAAGNLLEVKAIRGKVAHSYPIVVDVENDAAEIEITGGVGYAPVCFRGLTRHAGYDLFMTANGKTEKIDQSVHGNDFWQTGYCPKEKKWKITYNVNLDSAGDEARVVKLGLRKR